MFGSIKLDLSALFVQIFRDMPGSAGGSTNMQLNLSRRRSTESKAPSCSERPLTLFHTPTHSQKGDLNTNIRTHPHSQIYKHTNASHAMG